MYIYIVYVHTYMFICMIRWASLLCNISKFDICDVIGPDIKYLSTGLSNNYGIFKKISGTKIQNNQNEIYFANQCVVIILKEKIFLIRVGTSVLPYFKLSNIFQKRSSKYWIWNPHRNSSQRKKVFKLVQKQRNWTVVVRTVICGKYNIEFWIPIRFPSQRNFFYSNRSRNNEIML